MARKGKLTVGTGTASGGDGGAPAKASRGRTLRAAVVLFGTLGAFYAWKRRQQQIDDLDQGVWHEAAPVPDATAPRS